MKKSTLEKIWKTKTVAETRALYAEWAAEYEADMTLVGYVTPDRIARLAAGLVADLNAPVLDYGCGTGLSCQAMHRAGFTTLDGMDISPEMLAYAQSKNIYRAVIQGTAGSLGDIKPGDYGLIIAAGVISLGAAQPETLNLLLDHLASEGLLVFSYNQPTLNDPGFMDRLAAVQSAGIASLKAEESGPHMAAKGVKSTIFALQKT